MEKPPSTPKNNAHEAEEMVDDMLLSSPLPDANRSDERLPEGDGSDKLPEEEDGQKLPGEGDDKLPEEAPAGKLVPFCTEEVLFFALNLIK